MALIHIEHPVRSTPEELLQRFQDEIVSHPMFRTYVDQYEVRGHQLTFHSAQGVEGVVEVTPGLMTVDLTLTGMTAFLKPLIESKLKDALAQIA